MKKITTKERIIAEAEKQFIDFGIANTQMKDIAASVEINRRTLYRYFKTKDELAFEIEMIIMKQIQDYMFVDLEDISAKTGFEMVEIYFDNVNFEDIKRQMKFTAEFDRYFQDDYPTPQLEESFVVTMEPSKDQLYQYIIKGTEDGSIRNDISGDDIYHFISQNFFAMFQRLILREKHLKNEYCDQVDFQQLFKDIILSGIIKR
ncbi:MAG: TetR/AcrR family transcriptional regulator [Spirochaetaceae bacterium]